MASGHAAIRLHDLRDYTDDRHHTVDDRPFGGGPGMVFKPEPLFRAVEALRSEAPEKDLRVILLSPQGRLLTQAVAEELSHAERLVLICGRYEGVDERVAENLVTDEISIGDFVLSGGELPAAVVMEATIRLLPGVLGNEESTRAGFFCRPGGRAGGSPSWVARLPALYAPGGVSRMESAGSSAFRQPRADSPVAAPAGAGKNLAAAARLARPGSPERGRPPVA